MLSVADSAAAISLVLGTWHAIGYFWSIFVRHLTSQKCRQTDFECTLAAKGFIMKSLTCFVQTLL